MSTLTDEKAATLSITDVHAKTACQVRMPIHVGAGAGHVRAAAATAIAFLACHPIGAKGDECMWGPYRETLLEAGALRVLLEVALAPTEDGNCRKVIEKAAAVGVMYLCTVVSALRCSVCLLYLLSLALPTQAAT